MDMSKGKHNAAFAALMLFQSIYTATPVRGLATRRQDRRRAGWWAEGLADRRAGSGMRCQLPRGCWARPANSLLN